MILALSGCNIVWGLNRKENCFDIEDFCDFLKILLITQNSTLLFFCCNKLLKRSIIFWNWMLLKYNIEYLQTIRIDIMKIEFLWQPLFLLF